jgi:glutathione synthase/RimK-type ligase-like ATP-grasp enzyme
MRFLIIDKRKRVGNIDTLHYAVQRLQEALDSKSVEHDFCHYDEIALQTKNNKLIIHAKDKQLDEYTHIIFRGHRTHYEYMLKYYIVQYADKNDIRVQNSEFIKTLPYYNKLNQMIIMAQNDIPYIDSYYSLDGHYDKKSEALADLDLPVIYKHTEGKYRVEKIDGKNKLKKNIYLAENKDELKELIEKRDNIDDKFINKPSYFFLQKFEDIGEDYRAMMIGGKYLGGWKRVATEGFLTVRHGEYSLYNEPSDKFRKFSEKVAKVFKADYCAIDIIYSGDKPYVLEINMEPGFKSYETKLEGNDVKVAEAMVEHMMSK